MIILSDILFLSHETEHRNDSRWPLSPAPRACLVLRNFSWGSAAPNARLYAVARSAGLPCFT